MRCGPTNHKGRTVSEPIGVLMMAYGGPDKLEDVEPYLLDVRGYRETPAEIVEEVRERYERIGGRSPILEHTEAQRERLAQLLADRPGAYQVFLGMRHWHPFLSESLKEILSAGLQKVVGLVMAPHYSRMSVQAYYDRLQEAIDDSERKVEVAPIHSWHLASGYLDALEARIDRGLQQFATEDRPGVHLVFTAHSLPERILEWDDPYPTELHATFQALRSKFPDQPSHFAYQSAAMTPDPWLGPDAGDLMADLVEAGEGTHFLLVPIGFVSEHVEILYDIDIEFKERIAGLGGRLERIEMPGADASMIASLADRVVAKAQDRGWL